MTTFQEWKKMMDESGDKVCPKWKHFIHFLFDMGTKPDDLSLHRINKRKVFSLENCQWGTPEQRKGKRFKQTFQRVQIK